MSITTLKQADWKKLISEKAIEKVFAYEKARGMEFERVDKDGVGYDVQSSNGIEERFIEVKGVSESWKTYTWQNLHNTEIVALHRNPEKFFLYIVYFDIPKEKRNEEELNIAKPQLYIIPGKDLIDPEKFKIKEASSALSPISREKLKPYEADTAYFIDD